MSAKFQYIIHNLNKSSAKLDVGDVKIDLFQKLKECHLHKKRYLRSQTGSFNKPDT